MRLAPVGEAAVTFAFVVSEGRIHFAVAAVAYFGRFDHASRSSAPVEHNPAFARLRCVRLIFGAAGGGLDTLENKFEQFVGKRRPVAEGERTQIPIFFG